MRILGSHTRAEAGPSNDVNLVVDMNAKSSLLDLIALKLAVEDELGLDVGVATEAALPRRLKDQFLSEAVPL